jgi:glutamate carboxypeptidase
MDLFLREARRRLPQTIELIRDLVECESPSGEAAAIRRFTDLLADRVGDLARVWTFSAGRHIEMLQAGGFQGPHFRCEFKLPALAKSGRGKQGQVLALGHSDTVWPLGTLRSMPFRRSRGRLYGPGVFDMKSGLALFITAMRILRDLDVPVRRDVVLQVNSDEEIGSPTSRALTEQAARESIAVLVLEPAAGPDGKLKTARKGVGAYTVTVRGVPVHAGLDFEKGASAIVEMARQIGHINGFTRLDRGITVNPGIIRGGSRNNVVAGECSVEVDVRVACAADARYLERCFHSLKVFDKRCSVYVEGGLNRPPLERSAGVRKLFGLAARLAREIGVELGECAVGGASDGNFTAALGVPTLDGLGAVGEGAHAPNESVVIGRLAERSALLAKLTASL